MSHSCRSAVSCLDLCRNRVQKHNNMLKIGTFALQNPLVLAPMAGYTDAAFRSLCVEQGAALTYTEMISAKALYYRNKNTKPLLLTAENEGPVALQLFGNDPELLAEEAVKLEEGPYDLFDVNMGCPVPKVVGNGEGSALMLQPKLVASIVSTMSSRLHKPVSVKIRKGFDENHVNAVEIAKIAEDNGAAMIAVHGRTREQMYHGKADYEIIARVKEAVRIPVLGSGDIYTREDAQRMLRETGVDGIMIARGVRGNPWIFRAILDPAFQRPEIEEVKAMILRQLDLMLRYGMDERLAADQAGGIRAGRDSVGEDQERLRLAAEYSAVRQMRKHVGFYAAGYPNASAFRREINRCDTLEQFRETLTLWNV